MAMSIKDVIAGLQGDVAAGYFTMDDVLVIDWFSFRDVQRTADDFSEDDNDNGMDDATARKLWEVSVDRIDTELEWFEGEQINEIIQEVVNKNGQ